MRAVNFDYANTCPHIDRAIDSARGEIENTFDSLLEEVCPLLPDDFRKAFAKEMAEDLYKNLEDCFEAVRKTNEDMRGEADKQIAALKYEISDLEHQLKQLEKTRGQA